ncbi:MAG TPA: DUF4190 domain-containing protein [Actinophytocola sp.]|jgi:hypothetical protein|nr:DUF4190 domain-containing protein [Actinophytocola sp.]
MTAPEQFPPPAQPYPPQPYSQAPQPYAPQQPYPYPVTRPTSGLAVAALVLGIVWVWGIGSILAVIFGHIALSETKNGRKGGQGLAVAGLVLGWIGVASMLIILITAAAV